VPDHQDNRTGIRADNNLGMILVKQFTIHKASHRFEPGNTIGERVRWARQQLKLSIRDLARTSQVSEVTISHIENRPHTRHDVGTVRLLAYSLHQPVYFIGCYDLIKEDDFKSSLKKMRLMAGLYICELAKRIQIDPSQLVKYENGSFRPYSSTLLKMIQVFEEIQLSMPECFPSTSKLQQYWHDAKLSP